MRQKGQAVLLVVMILGTIMALIVIFGAKRQADASELIARLDTSQISQEVLSAAAKRVQQIYANQSSCDPSSLDIRLSSLPAVSSDPEEYGSGMNFSIADPGGATLDQRANRCSGNGEANNPGCRQFAIALENRVYIVTAGAVVTGPPAVAGQDCPRDATIRLSVAIGGNLFYQRFTLINICTFDSCNTNFDDFTAFTGSATGTFFTSADACTGANSNVPERWHGSIASASKDQIGLDDLRWARRYVETGAGDIGETTFMRTTTPITNGNGSCTPATSAGQCHARNCVPAFDLNRDRTNNEADLAIMEMFLRGYLPSLSPIRLDPRP